MPHRVPIDGTLDLHAFRPRDVASVVLEYLEAAWSARLLDVRLIHGRGHGVQRATVHRVLTGHPRVAAFHDAPESHLGATVVTLVSNGASNAVGTGVSNRTGDGQGDEGGNR